MHLDRKLAILADAAKYDASCASSGTLEARLARRQGHRLDRGLGHLPQLCARRPLHLAAEDPAHQFLRLRLPLLRQPRLEQRRARPLHGRRGRRSSRSTSIGATASRACSSARESSSSPDYTMEQVVEVARVLREEHDFRGYIHLKTIPEASPELLARAGRYADRLSINIELPTAQSLAALAPEKDGAAIRRSMARLRMHIDEAKDAARPRPVSVAADDRAEAGRAAALRAGRPEHADDRRRRCRPATARSSSTSAALYGAYRLKRVYYSAFSPIPDAARALPLQRAAAGARASSLSGRLADALLRLRARRDRRRRATACSRSRSIPSSPGRSPIASASRSTSIARRRRCCCACPGSA